MPKPQDHERPPRLRQGFSTGACAAALAVAAWRQWREPLAAPPGSVILDFPDGKQRQIDLCAPLRLSPLPGGHDRPGPRWCCLRKDAGDDPDVTDNALIYARLRPAHPGEAAPEDIVLPVGEGARLILHAVEGIGLCTRDGLDCPRGKWAINSGPRAMLARNLARAGLNEGWWLLEIGISHGAELAGQTLNSRLGIVGGLSLLGTTGLVRPYSHAAYVATIRLCTRAHQRAGGKHMIYATGGRSLHLAQARHPQQPETGFALIGDFIAASLAVARRCGMRRVTVACMPGKLCKYAAGLRNTHAHRHAQDREILRQVARRLLPEASPVHAALAHCVSVREALGLLPPHSRLPLLRIMADQALRQLRRMIAAPPNLAVLVCDVDGSFLFEQTLTATAEERRPPDGDQPKAAPPAAPKEVC